MLAAAVFSAGCAAKTTGGVAAATSTEAPTTTVGAVTSTSTPVTTPVTLPVTIGTTGVPAPAVAAGGVPADMLNPAVTQATIGTTICVAGYTATIRPSTSVTGRIKARQIIAYGYPDQTIGSYTEDHVIALEVGGASAAESNLWPQLAGPAGSDDNLENSLHTQLCKGTVTLAAAQAQAYAAKLAHGYRRQASVAP